MYNLLLDVDGPLTEGYVVESCNILQDLGVAEAYPDSVTTWDPADSFNITGNVRDQYHLNIRLPGVAARMLPRPGVEDFLTWARAEFARVIALTTPLNDSPTWCFEREKWLKDRLSFRTSDIIFAKDKTLVPGILVDDKITNVRGRVDALLWDTKYNRGELDHVRVRGYGQLRQRLEILTGGIRVHSKR